MHPESGRLASDPFQELPRWGRASKSPRLDGGQFVTVMEVPGSDRTFESVYSWIPSNFHVSEDGLDVHIESYINGLGPREQYPVLYRLLEKQFLLALPHFERTLGCEFEASLTPSGEHSPSFTGTLSHNLSSRNAMV